MAAVVSGSSLGLLNSSLALLGSRGSLGSAAQGNSGERVYVNAATGNLVVQRQDEVLIGTGLDAALVRTYNSRGLLDDDNGDNWRLGVYRKVYGLTGTLNAANSTIKRVAADGAESIYTYDTNASKYLSSDGDGAKDTLSYNAGTQVWTWTDGSTQAQEKYDGANGGRITQALDADGNALTFTYNGSGLITQVSDASGETTYLDYTGTNLTQLRTVKSGNVTLIRVRYGYDASNRLSSVTVDLTPEDNTDAKTYVTTYTYDGTSKRVASLTQSDGTSLTFEYTLVGSDYRVWKITDALGHLTRFDYVTATRTTTVTDPLGLATTMVYDTSGQLTSVTSPAAGGAAAQTVSFAYDANGNVTQTTDAKGNAVVYQYDANNNRTLERDVAGNTITRVYSAANQLLNETAYVVPDQDGAGTGQPAAPLTTRFAYDAEQHLRFAVSAEGRVTEYRYNAAGQRTAALVYAGNAYSLTGLGVTDTLSESTLNTWATGATVDKTAIQRTDYTYDFRGQLSSATTYGQTDSSGNGVASTRAETDYIYDQAGNLLKTIDPRGVATTGDPNDFVTNFVYDGLGRVTSTTDSAGNQTLTEYDAANRKVKITLANSLVRTSTYDTAGELVSFAESFGTVLGETKYFYDADGNLRRVEDPTGVKTHILYDEAGRKVADIDGTGSLTEYRYDANNNLTRTIRYATAVSAANLTSLGTVGAPTTVMLAAIRPAADAAHDRSTWNAYDAANRLVKSVDELGYVTQNFYDGDSRLTDSVRYATPIATGSLGDAPAASAIAPATWIDDRLSRAFYDGDGKLLGTLDGEGYLTENLYDAAGQLVETVAYATATTASQRATGTLAQLRPAAAASDIHTYARYNARGQLARTIDGEGYLTEYTYDAAGNKTQEKRYASKVTSRALNLPGASASYASTPDSAANSITGDIDIRVKAAATDWTPAGFQHLISKRYDGGAQGAWLLRLSSGSSGTLDFEWTENGSTWKAAYSTVPPGLADGATKWIRVTLDVDNGSGGRSIKFYTSDDGTTWAQLGATVTQTGVTSIADTTASLQVGGANNGNELLAGRIYYAEVRNGIDGAVAAKFDPSIDVGAPGATSFSSSIGEVWTTYGSAVLDAISSTGAQTHGYTYDALNRIATETAPDGVVTTYTYDSVGNLVKTVKTVSASDSTEVQTLSARYDKQGRVTMDLSGVGNALIASTPAQTEQIWADYGVDYAYDAAGRKISATDARGNKTLLYYDADGRVVYTINALGEVKGAVYNTLGQLVQSVQYAGRLSGFGAWTGGFVDSTVSNAVNALGNSAVDSVIGYAYALNGQLVQTVDGAGTVDTATYNAFDEAIDTTHGGVETRSQVDRRGQVASVTIDPHGLALKTTYTYDAYGRKLTVTEGAGGAQPRVTAYEYDRLGRVTKETVDQGASPHLNLATTYVYDKNGNVVSTTNANNVTTRYVYDAADRLVYAIVPVGTSGTLASVTKNEYGANGRVSRVTSYINTIDTVSLPAAPALADIVVTADVNRDRVVSYFYDKDGRESQCTDAVGTVTTKTYDRDGHLIRSTTLGEVTRYVYDAAGRLAYTITPADTDRYAVTGNQYDGKGNLVRAIAFGNTITDTSDLSVAQVQTLVGTNALDRVTRHVFDAANREVFTIDSGNYVKETRYDDLGRVTQTVEYPATISVGDFPTAAQVRTALALATTATYTNDTTGPTASPVQPYSYLASAKNDTATPATQSVSVSSTSATVVNNALIQPYTYIGSAKADSATPTTQNVSLSVENTSIPQSANVANYAWTRSGSSIVQTTGLSITPGSATYGDTTPTMVRATILQGTTQIGQLNTDVGYNSTDSWSVSYQHWYLAGYDDSGPVYSWYWDSYTAYGTRWNAVGNWGGQVNISTGTLAAGTYQIRIETADTATSGNYVENGFYDNTDGTWGTNTNTITVNVGLQVRPSYVRWATSTQPAGTSTVTFKYRTAGSTGAYTNATLGVNGANHEANLGSISAGNYEYVIEYRDSYGRVLKSASGTLTNTDGQTTSASATFNYTTLASSAAAGSSIRYFTAASQWAPVDHVSATVRDEAGVTVISTAVTYPEAESAYNGEVNLKTGAVLGNGRYKVELVIYNKDGTTTSIAPFLYEVGPQTYLQQTLSWAAGTQPAGTTAVLMYRPQGGGTWLSKPVTTAGANQQSVFDWINPGTYEYTLEYRDSYNRVIKNAAGTFTATSPSGSSSSNVTFSYTAYASTATTGSSIAGYIAPANVPTIARVEAEVRDYTTNAVVSTATTYPEFESGYNGNVNLSVGGPLHDGRYNVTVTVFKKDGTSSASTFYYEVGQQPFARRTTTIAWSDTTQPAGTTVEFAYVRAGQGGETLATVTHVGNQYRATLVRDSDDGVQTGPADGIYGFTIRYKDNTSAVVKQASGQVLAQASGDGQVTLAFTGSAPVQERINSFAYDRAGRLIQSTDPLGFSESFGYDALGNKTSFTNKKGSVWTYAFDGAGRMTDELSPAVTVTSTSGTVTNNVVLQTHMVYDALGNVTERTEAFGRTGEARTTKYQYDAAGNQTKTIFPTVGVYDATKDDLSPAANNLIDRTTFENTVPDALYSQVTYDALGRAVANRAADGTYSYKVYDPGGRVRYEIDAEKYVTQHDYDAFGNDVALIRYANRIVSSHADGTAWSVADVAGLLPAQPGAIDRKIEKAYDTRNLLVQVKEPKGYAYDSASNTGKDNVQRTTLTDYNAFGEVVRQRVSATVDASGNTSTWADTYSYYDARGKRTAQVDADGFLTTWEYDAAGNTTKTTEFARAVPASLNGYALPLAGNADTGYDRVTAYGYDLADRKISETALGARYYKIAATDQNALQAETGDVTTNFAYDAVGNLVATTDANGATSYIYYDALGRTYATAAPARMTAEASRGGQTVTPLTVLGLDAFGKTVRERAYANGATSASATGFTAGAESAADQLSTTAYDALGHAIQSTDAEGKSKYFSYDAAGRVAKTWQPVTQNLPGYLTPFTQYSVQAYKYDALGNQVATIDASTRWDYADGANLAPGGSGLPVGNFIAQGASYWQEPVYNDAGGITGYIDHWQPNNSVVLAWGQNLAAMGSGDVQVRLGYNYANGGSIERVFTYGSAAATTGVTVTWSDSTWNGPYGINGVKYVQVYKKNAAGDWVLVQDTNDPVRGYADTAYPAATNYTFSVGGSVTQTSTHWQDPITDDSGAIIGYTDHWQPSNTVNAWWGADLAALGGGAVQVVLTYNYAVGGGSGERTFNLAATTGMGAALSWSDGGWSSPYGVASIARLRIYKANAAGAMVLLQDTSANGWSSTMVGWRTTADADPVSLAYQTTVNGSWTSAAATNFGAVTLADVRSTGAIELEMRRTANGEPVYTYQRGAAAAGGFTGTVILNRQGAAYNAFGEIVSKDVDARATEYFDYDAAGRLWRTNQNDGVDKIHLYDVEGNATAEIRSLGADLHTQYANAAAADSGTRLAGSAVRSETQYDKLGRVVARELPAYGAVDPAVVSAPAAAANSVWWNIANGGFWAGSDSGYLGMSYLYAGWTSLAGWGNGNIFVSADVVTAHSGTVTLQQTVSASTASATLAFADDIVSVSRMRVWKYNDGGSLALVRDSAASAPKQVTFASPVLQQSDYAVFSYKLTSASTWSSATAADFGAVSMVDTAAWAAGTYNYKIEYKNAAGTTYATGTGTLTASSGSVAVTPDGAGGQATIPLVQQAVDRWGNTLSVLDPRYATDPNAAIDPDGTTAKWQTKYQYDNHNQLLVQTGPLVAMKKENGAVVTIRPETRNFYDKLGRAIGTQDANAAHADGDNDGLFEYASTVRYNAAGQATRQIHADGGIVDYQYGVFEQQVAEWDARDKKTSRTYDHLNRLTQITRPDDSVVLYEYDELGDRVRERDARGYWTSYAYDARGRVIRSTAPNGQSTFTYYDDLGNKSREVNANGQVQSWTYKADAFGRATTYSDLANVVATYTYNELGQVFTSSSSRAQNTYTYDINGALKKAENTVTSPSTWTQTTEYQYDAVGNRTRETFKRGGTTYLDTAVTYDALNRVVSVTDTRYTLNYFYDANGNRREAQTNFFNNLGQWTSKDYWYKYDSMNRIVLSQGTFDVPTSSMVIGTQGTTLAYDLAGNRTLANGASTGGAAEAYIYDANGRLIQTNRNGNIASSRVYDAAGNVTASYTYNGGGTLTGYQTSSYDANGWLGQQNNYKRLYYTDGGGNSYLWDAINSQVTYSGRDGLGEVTSYSVGVWNPYVVDQSYGDDSGFHPNVWLNNPWQYTNWYSTSYTAYGSSNKESNVHGTSTYFLAGDTTTRYDGNGSIYDVSDQFAGSNYRSFITDATGRILQKTQGGQNEYYFYGNDKPLGATGANGAADFDFNYTPVSDNYPASSPSSMVVSAGDTLQSIAQSVYGDAGLWYLIADANGITGGASLKIGMTLNIPNKITNLHNTYQTFKPYDAGKIIGDTTPTLPNPPPPPPPPHKKKCGGILTILIVVIAVVAAIFTAGAALTALAPALTGGMTTVVGSAWTVGMSAMAGGFAGTSIAGAALAAAAIGGAVGSIASQLTGMALGVQDKFSWSGVAAGAIGAGVTAGIGGAAWTPQGGGVAGAMGVKDAVGQLAINNAVGNAVSQGVSILTGQQDRFNWRSVAASAIAAPFAYGAGEAISKASWAQSNPYGQLAVQTARGIAGGVVRQVAYSGSADVVNIATDAFGNALGDSIVSGDLGTALRAAAAAYPEVKGEDFDGDGRMVLTGGLSRNARFGELPPDFPDRRTLQTFQTPEEGRAYRALIKDRLAEVQERMNELQYPVAGEKLQWTPDTTVESLKLSWEENALMGALAQANSRFVSVTPYSEMTKAELEDLARDAVMTLGGLGSAITGKARGQGAISAARVAAGEEELIRVGEHRISKAWQNESGQLEWIDPRTNVRSVLTKENGISVDHILPRRAFYDIPEFVDLPRDVRRALINDPDNLRPMAQSANSSKGAKVEGFGSGFQAWKGEPVNADYRAELLRIQNQMREKVQNTIRSRKGGG